MSSSALAIDARRVSVVSNRPVDTRPHVAAWVPDGSRVFAISETSGARKAIAGRTHELRSKIRIVGERGRNEAAGPASRTPSR